MSEIDAEQFEAEKYAEYFPKLEQAYRRAFETMNDAFDSQLIHAIDQQVLSESEPVYTDSDGFRIELPADPYDRLQGVLVDEEQFEAVLERYVSELVRELERVFEQA